KIKNIKQLDGKTSFALQGIESDFELRVPGLHNVLNSAAAAAVSACVASFINRKKISDVLKADGKKIASGVRNFKGSKRRSELLGEACGIVFMDDYGHHPTAIEATLSGLRSFYPGKRIIVDFMSHTYSRTKALLDDFASSFSDADVVILNKIYSSAREKSEGENSIDNEFFIKAKKNHGNVFFYKEPSDAAGFLKNELRKGDLFLTMGAGDNWKLGQTLYTFFKRKESDKGNK
ncbi:MAG: cyanophycin synthetase, partial [Spirochaetia bacterium]|nr:cyanophycin synthetase [Spirochaetia bacterium]